MAEVTFTDNSDHYKGLDIFKKLDRPVRVTVELKLDLAYQKKVLDFFMKYGKDEYVSVSQMYKEVFPERGRDDDRMISIFLSKLEGRGVLWPSIPGVGVEYPKGSRTFLHGYMMNPGIKIE